MRRLLLVALLAAWLPACSNAFDSPALRLKYQPPRNAKLLEESAGPPRLARFDNGFEIRAVDAEPLAIDETRLDQLLPLACDKAGFACGQKVSSKAGSIGNRAVARFTFKEGGDRRLLYYLPAGKRYLVLTFTASEASYDKREIEVDRSLGSLKVRD